MTRPSCRSRKTRSASPTPCGISTSSATGSTRSSEHDPREADGHPLLDFCRTGCLDRSEFMISTAGELKEPVATSRRLILWLVLLAQFVVVLDGTIVAVPLPPIHSDHPFSDHLSPPGVIHACMLLLVRL